METQQIAILLIIAVLLIYYFKDPKYAPLTGNKNDLWNHCKNTYAQTCNPNLYFGMARDFHGEKLIDEEGKPFSCVNAYKNSATNRRDFNNDYFGTGTLRTPNGALYKQYCSTTSGDAGGDAALWGKCKDIYAKTCNPDRYFSREKDFHSEELLRSDGSVFSCTDKYQTDAAARNDFQQAYYGDGGLYNPNGVLYQKYCGDSEDPYNDLMRKVNARTQLYRY